MTQMTPVPSYATSREITDKINYYATNYGVMMPWEQNIFAYRLDNGFIRVRIESGNSAHGITITEDAFKKLIDIFSNLPADKKATR